MRFRAILRRQPFSRTKSSTQLSQSSQERSFFNFHAQPLPIFVIWPVYATSAIPYDSETVTFFARPIAHAIITVFSGAFL